MAPSQSKPSSPLRKKTRRTAESDATWDDAPSRGNVHEAERRRAERLEAEDALYGVPAKLPVEYLCKLSPKSLRKVPASAFPKTKISFEERHQPPYNKLQIYVEPAAQLKAEVSFEDAWMESCNIPDKENYEPTKEAIESWLEGNEEELQLEFHEDIASQYTAEELFAADSLGQVTTDSYCSECGDDPCVLDQYHVEFVQHVDYLREENKPNNLSRKAMYRHMFQLMNGFLGKGIREELPGCVTSAIREEFESSNYMGYKTK